MSSRFSVTAFIRILKSGKLPVKVVPKTSVRKIAAKVISEPIPPECKTAELCEMVIAKLSSESRSDNEGKDLHICQRVSRMVHGTKNEPKVLDYYLGVTRLALDKKKLYKRNIDSQIEITGRVDGSIVNKDRVVEVKSRISKIRDSPTENELIQMNMYMWLSDTHICDYVQERKGLVAVRIIKRDDIFIKKLIERFTSIINGSV
jgi:hypothetical protein